MIDFEQTVLSQYAGSPTIARLVSNMNAYVDTSTNFNQFFEFIWNVDTAIGNGLDIWGRIVGVTRVLKLSTTSYFGLTGPAGASGLPFNQAPFYNGQTITANYYLTDAVFRVLILAKALANISNATIQSINQILINLFGIGGPLPVVGNCYCTDLGGMAMTFTFGSPLSAIQKSIVYQSGVLPRPIGVTATIVEL